MAERPRTGLPGKALAANPAAVSRSASNARGGLQFCKLVHLLKRPLARNLRRMLSAVSQLGAPIAQLVEQLICNQ